MGIYRLELLWAYIDWSYCGHIETGVIVGI